MISSPDLYLVVHELTTVRDLAETRRTDSGYGFYRWIRGIDVSNKINVRYSTGRRYLDKLVKAGLLLRRKNPGALVTYSVVAWEGCEPKGDYFIYHNPNTHDKVNRRVGPEAIAPQSNLRTGN